MGEETKSKAKEKQNTKHQKSFILKKKKKEIKVKIIRDIWALFETRRRKKERNQKKKELCERLIKDRIRLNKKKIIIILKE